MADVPVLSGVTGPEENPDPVVPPLAQHGSKVQAEINNLERMLGIGIESPESIPLLQPQVDVLQMKQDLQNAPVTQQYIADPKKATLVQPHVKNLAEIEAAASNITPNRDIDGGTRERTTGEAHETGKIIRRISEAGGNLFEAEGKGDEARAIKIREQIKGLQQKIAGFGDDPEGFFNYLNAAAEMLGTMEGGFPVILGAAVTGAGAGGIVAGPAGALVGAGRAGSVGLAIDSFKLEGMLAYVDLREQGVPIETAQLLSTGVGIINAGLEVASYTIIFTAAARFGKSAFKLGVKEAIKNPSFLRLAGKFAQAYGTGMLGEAFTEAMQEMVNIAAEEIGKQFTGEESITFDEFSARIGHVVEKTLKAMVFFGPLAPGVSLPSQIRNIRQAKKDKVALDQLKAMIEEGDLSSLDEEASVKHTTALLENLEHSEVYIPGQALQDWADSIADPGIISRLDVQTQIEEAILSGNDVTISAEKFTREVLMHDSYDTLSPHIRMGINSDTEFEALTKEGAGINSEIDALDLEQVFPEERAEEVFDAEIGRDNTVEVTKNPSARTIHRLFAAATKTELDKPTPTGEVFLQGDGRLLRYIFNPETKELFVWDASKAIHDEIKGVEGAEGTGGVITVIEGKITLLEDAPGGPVVDNEAIAAIKGQGVVSVPEQQVGAAEDSLGMRAIVDAIRQALGFSGKQTEDYLLMIAKAKDEAANKQEKKLLKEQQKQLTKEWKKQEQAVREEVSAELLQKPVYQAFIGLKDVRLNKQQVEEALEQLSTEEAPIKLSDLPVLAKGRKVYNTKKNQTNIPLNPYAGLFGYETGMELLKDLLSTKPLQEAIAARTNEIMQERNATLLDAQRALMEARKTLHETSEYSTVLIFELNAMREARKEGKLTPAILKRAARERIREYTIRELNVNKFLAAEKRAAEKAGKAIKAGDIEAAQRFKFQQVMNHLMATEAYKVKAENEKRFADLQKWSKFKQPRKGDEKRKKEQKLPVLYQEAVTEVVKAVGIDRALAAKRRKALKELKKKKDDRPDIPDELLDTEQDINYKDMTTAEFTRIWETVKDIRHKGHTENSLRLDTEKKSRDEIAEEVAGKVVENLTPIKAQEDRNLWENTKRYGSEALNLLYNADTLLAELDGGTALGTVYSNLKGRYDRANSEGYRSDQMGYLRRQKKVARDLLNLYKPYTKKERKAFNKKLTIEGVGRPLTRQEVVMVLLNSGNQGNIDALTDSNQFTIEEIEAVREFASPKDLAFMQSVFDYLETFAKEIQEAESRRRNYSPEMVEALSFEVGGKTYKGGYFPLRYDNKEAVLPKTEDVQTLHDQARFGSFISHHTARGHTEARKNSAGQKVLMDLFTLNAHVDQVVYDLEVGDAVTDIWKILSHPDVKSAFNDTGHGHKFDWLELWTRDVTTDQVFQNNMVERSLRWLRSGYTVSKLGWNVGVGLLQPLGLMQASVFLGHENMAWAVKTVIMGKWTGENSIFEFVRNETGQMLTRGENYNKDISEAQRQLKFGILDRLTPGETASWVRNSMFWMIKTMQGLTDTITYLAAKKKGMKDFNGDELQAKRFADRAVVRSQASGIFGERTNIERGSISKRQGQSELIRAFSVFISYFMAKTNVAITRTRETQFKNPAQALRWARDMLILYTLEAMAAAYILNRVDDDEPFITNVLSETANTILAGIPFLREVGAEVQGFRGGGVPSAVARDFARVWKQMSQGELDAELFQSANNAAGVVLHYPAAQINKTLRAFIARSNHEDVKAIEFLLGPEFNK